MDRKNLLKEFIKKEKIESILTIFYYIIEKPNEIKWNIWWEKQVSIYKFAKIWCSKNNVNFTEEIFNWFYKKVYRCVSCGDMLNRINFFYHQGIGITITLLQLNLGKKEVNILIGDNK